MFWNDQSANDYAAVGLKMSDQGRKARVLGIVPARGGSKGIARKNVRVLAGRPLLAYTASAALKSVYLSRILLSTEDAEIANVGRQVGLEAPFVRPPELALDSTPMMDVVLHAVRWVQGHGEEYDAVCLLQPTSPLRRTSMIDRCISLFFAKGVDSVVSVRPVPLEYNPHWVYFEAPDGLLQPSTGQRDPIPTRQLLPPAYHRDGSVFVTRTNILLTQGSLYGTRTLGVVSPDEEAIDLDTEDQWESLERRLQSELTALPPPFR